MCVCVCARARVYTQRLFVGNLPYTVTSTETLKPFFTDAIEIVLPVYHDTGKQKGYAYVVFESAEAAQASLTKNQGTFV